MTVASSIPGLASSWQHEAVMESSSHIFSSLLILNQQIEESMNFA
jgi:hypothetical protein